MAKKGFLKDNNEIMLPITRGELVLDSSGQLAFHSGQFLATEDCHGLMSNEDKTNIKNIIEKTNNLDTNTLNLVINSIKNAYLKSVKVDNNNLIITDQSDTETNFYNTIYTFESGTSGSFTVKENGTNSKTISVGGILTDEKVIQKNITNNKEYRILLSNSDNDDTEIASSNKSEKLLFNPYTGVLTANTINVTGSKSNTTAKITSDATYNMYLGVNGKTPLVIADDDNSNIFVAPGILHSNRYSLGTSNRKWKDVYATTFYGALSGNATSATTANCLADKSKGSATQPVYINASGRPVACTYTADDFARGESSEATLPATAGWYRIAISRASIMNCEGIFQICGEVAGKHTSCIITAGTSYGLGASTNVQVLSCHNWSTSALTKVRIVYNTSYTGNYAYLEVYSSNAAAIVLTVRKLDGIGWSLTDPKTAGSIPSGYSYKEVTLSNGTIVAPTFIATSNIYTSGSVNASAGFYETSDERLKNFSNRIDVHLDRLAKLKKHYFTWKDSENKEQQIGVSAQEIRELYPEIVSEQDNGTLVVAYDKLSVIALAAIDKLYEENQKLEERLNILENKIK